MLCFRCGSPVEGGAVRCTNCGQDLSEPAQSDPTNFAELQKKLRQTGREWVRAVTYRAGEVVRDRYEIRDVIGTGALGTVYKAFDQEVEVDVAVKVLAGEFLPDEDARRHFLGALQPLRSLVHPNAVRYFDVDRDGDRCFYVMQFLEGLTLRKILQLRRDKGQRFAVSELEPIFVQLCRAIGDTCQRMTHGGLKPENIIILPDLLKVTDFGLPYALPRVAYLAAQRGAGEAYSYLAPEVRAKEPCSPRSDVYSIAVMLIELLSGSAYEDGLALEAGLRDVPIAFERVLKRALSEAPEVRHADARELGEDLTAALTGRAVRTTLPYGSVETGAAAARAEAGAEARDTDETGPTDQAGGLPVPGEPLAGDVRDTRGDEEPEARPGGSSDTAQIAAPAALDSVLPDDPVATPDEKREREAMFPDDGTEDTQARPSAKRESQVTHQLDVEEIEFASGQVRQSASSADSDADDDDEELLLSSEPEPAERTERVSMAAIEARREPAPAAAGPARATESGVIEGTQRISAEMILSEGDVDETEDNIDTGQLRLVGPGALDSGFSAKEREAREARAREALQAFDFESTEPPEDGIPPLPVGETGDGESEDEDLLATVERRPRPAAAPPEVLVDAHALATADTERAALAKKLSEGRTPPIVDASDEDEDEEEEDGEDRLEARSLDDQATRQARALPAEEDGSPEPAREAPKGRWARQSVPDVEEPDLPPVADEIVARVEARAEERDARAIPQKAIVVAPEVLNRDAVPRPMQGIADVTLSVPRRGTTSKVRLIPVMVITFVVALAAGTFAVVYHIYTSRREAARLDLERKSAALAIVTAAQVDASVPRTTALGPRTRADAASAQVSHDLSAGAHARVDASPAAAPAEPEPRTAPAAVSPKLEPKARQGPSAAVASTSQVKEAAQARAEAKAREKAEARAKAKEDAKAKAEAKAKARAEAKAKADEAAKAKAEARARAKEEAKAKAEAKARAKAEQKAAAKAEAIDEPKAEALAASSEAGGKCPASMAFIAGRGSEEGYCIDRYEHPGKGRAPTKGVSVADARTACKARGQRLCSAREWLRSCGSLFPYGKTYAADKCTTGIGQPAPTGSKAGCRSRAGVYDLSGNVSEWVEEGVAMGGDATSEQGHASCPSRSAGGALTGFRCCTDPELD